MEQKMENFPIENSPKLFDQVHYYNEILITKGTVHPENPSSKKQ